jgi:hypothetical protein
MKWNIFCIRSLLNWSHIPHRWSPGSYRNLVVLVARLGVILLRRITVVGVNLVAVVVNVIIIIIIIITIIIITLRIIINDMGS